MDRQEVARPAAARSGRGRPAGPVRVRTPLRRYALSGVSFGLGFAALLLVVHGRFPWAGQLLLAATWFGSLDYATRPAPVKAPTQADEFASLSDLLSFAVVPAFLLYRLVFQPWGVLGFGTVFVVVFAGIVRLSLYRIYTPAEPRRSFIGLPLTVPAAASALLAQLVVPGPHTPFFRLGLLVGVVGLAFLTVSTLRYPDLTASPWFLALLAVGFGAVAWGAPIALPTVWVLLAVGVVFVLCAPLLHIPGAPAR